MALVKYQVDGKWQTLFDITNITSRLNRLEDVTDTLPASILLAAHPVGSYYWSANNTPPSTLFGGTWTQITGRFLYASDTPGATGGSETVTLTVDQIPSHTHTFSADCIQFKTRQYSITGTDASLGGTGTTNATGGGGSHENMPPYLSAYCWRRTA